MLKKNKCKASCCESFSLPYSYHRLARAYKAWRLSKKSYTWRGEERPLPKDIFLIYPMVIPLHGGKKTDKGPFPEKAYYYTCKHFDKKNRLCGIYSIRPSMCSRYPYAQACRYEGCKFRGGSPGFGRKEDEGSPQASPYPVQT